VIFGAPKNVKFDENEIVEILHYLRDGGAIILISGSGGDEYNSTNMNGIANHLGYKFNPDFFDLKIFIIQMFGGEGRYISPMYFNDFIILPPELVNYKYENEYTGESYVLDWKTNGAYEFLVETTNKNELVMPGKIKPRYILRGMSDGSTRYGGTDDIADWKLSTMVEYEIEIPSYIILKTDHIVDTLNFNIGYGSVYSKYSEYNLPANQVSMEVFIESNLNDDSNTIINDDSSSYLENLNNNENTNSIINPNLENDNTIYPSKPILLNLNSCPGKKIRREITFKTRYFHQITQEQQDSIEDIIIEIPEKVFDISLIKVQSKSGLMEYGSHYIIEPSCNEIRIKVENVKLKKGEFLEIFIYEVPFNQPEPIRIFGGTSVISTTNETPNRSNMEVIFSFRSSAKCKSTVNGVI